MGQFQSFAEILENKLRKEIEASVRREFAQGNEQEDSTSRSENQPNFQPDVLSLLLGRVTPLKNSHESSAKVYHQYRPAKRPTAPPKPAHKLTEAQSAAFTQFQSWGQGLADNFSSKDLKTAFRKMALKLHPDQGGNTQEFFKLQECYQTLNQVF